MTWCHRESSLITKGPCRVMTVLKRMLRYWVCHEQHSFRFLPILFSWQSLNWKHHLMKTGSSVLRREQYNDINSITRDLLPEIKWKPERVSHTLLFGSRLVITPFFWLGLWRAHPCLFFQHSQSKEKNYRSMVNLLAVPGMVPLSVTSTKTLLELYSTPISDGQE